MHATNITIMSASYSITQAESFSKVNDVTDVKQQYLSANAVLPRSLSVGQRRLSPPHRRVSMHKMRSVSPTTSHHCDELQLLPEKNAR